jgi:hypothetical protein
MLLFRLARSLHCRRVGWGRGKQRAESRDLDPSATHHQRESMNEVESLSHKKNIRTN